MPDKPILCEYRHCGTTGKKVVPGAARREALTRIADELSGDAGESPDAARVQILARAVQELQSAGR